MCYDAKVAGKRARNHSKGSKGRRKIYRSTYRNIDLWEIEQEYLSQED